MQAIPRQPSSKRPSLPDAGTQMTSAARIPYKPELAPTHPEFDKLLKFYEETARAIPSTRPYLNPKIRAMRGQAAGVAKQIEDVAKLLTITMADGTQLIGCTMSKIENGFAIIRHQDGVNKMSFKELNVTEKKP